MFISSLAQAHYQRTYIFTIYKTFDNIISRMLLTLKGDTKGMHL